MFAKIKHTLSLIRFSHTIFALPFALASMLLAADGLPNVRTIVLILACMVLARTSAMAFNRFIDADIDALNPRTQNRHIPSGILSKRYVIGLAILSGALFIATTYFLNSLSFYLSPLALVIVWFYSLTKRWTNFTQLFLGLALAISPIGAWVAVRGELNWPPVLLGIAVAFWVAGFDVFYSIQDQDFDQKQGLKSLVVKFGVRGSLTAARIFHLTTAIFLISVAWFISMPLIYLTTCGLVIALLIYEHNLIRVDDLTRIDQAFFTLNGWIGMLFLAGMATSVWMS